jgi:hypothetical protein
MWVAILEHLWKKGAGFGQKDPALQYRARLELANGLVAEVAERERIDGIIIVYAELAVAACPGGRASNEAINVNRDNGEESFWLEEDVRRCQRPKKSRILSFHFDCPVCWPTLDIIVIACS